MITVAVYGTLKKGHAANAFLQSSEFIGKGRTVSPFFVCTNGGYPVCTDYDAKHPVSVEVYNVSEETLARLDRYEGYPSLFTRHQEQVEVEGGEIECWLYKGNPLSFTSADVAGMQEVKVENGCYNW